MDLVRRPRQQTLARIDAALTSAGNAPLTNEWLVAKTGSQDQTVRTTMRFLGYELIRDPLWRSRFVWQKSEEDPDGGEEIPLPTEADPLPRGAIESVPTESPWWRIPVPDDLQRMAEMMRLGIEVRVWPLD